MRYRSTGSIVKSDSRTMTTEATMYKRYLKDLMVGLQNRARQEVFQKKPPLGPCLFCGEPGTMRLYVTYSPLQIVSSCRECHKEHSYMKGDTYTILKNNGVVPISWDEWKLGVRPCS